MHFFKTERADSLLVAIKLHSVYKQPLYISAEISNKNITAFRSLQFHD